jgi:hypothetical protein
VRLEWLFLILCGSLLLVAIVRWQRTPEAHSDYAARRETVSFLVALCAGGLVLLAQSRFALGSRGFWACSAGLVPIAGIVFVLLRRLFRAYRQQPADPHHGDRA